ncbi:MAG: hypothetical protein H0U58_04895 [Chloroflexi bacterium]|nr:hypothetical protein [Chloroflexota bacterium]
MTTRTTDEASMTSSTDRLSSAASGVAEEAGKTAEAKATKTMGRASETLDQLAVSIRQAGEGMRDEQPQLAGAADRAAEQVQRAGQYLREHEPREVLDTAQDMARRQPLLVVGGGLALGLLLGRLLRSAGPSGQQGGSDRAMGRTDEWSGRTGQAGSARAFGVGEMAENRSDDGAYATGGSGYDSASLADTDDRATGMGSTFDSAGIGVGEYGSATDSISTGETVMVSGTAVEDGSSLETGTNEGRADGGMEFGAGRDLERDV